MAYNPQTKLQVDFVENLRRTHPWWQTFPDEDVYELGKITYPFESQQLPTLNESIYRKKSPESAYLTQEPLVDPSEVDELKADPGYMMGIVPAAILPDWVKSGYNKSNAGRAQKYFLHPDQEAFNEDLLYIDKKTGMPDPDMLDTVLQIILGIVIMFWILDIIAPRDRK